MKTAVVQFHLNDEERAELIEAGATLLTTLRTGVGDFSPKAGCQQGTCGACTVLIDGEVRLACITLAEDCNGRHIQTAKCLESDAGLHVLQQAFIDCFATQCGYCTPGMLMAAKALLDINPNPSRNEVIDAIGGNVCRCTGYEPIIVAILQAATVRLQRLT
jgi:aerobic carbon-monoxide dehydrogenase small subunit